MHTNLLSVSGKKEEQTSTLHLGVFQFYVFGLCLGSIVCWRYAKKKGQSTGGTQKNCSRIHSSFTFIQKLLQFSVRQATKSYYLKQNKTKQNPTNKNQQNERWEHSCLGFPNSAACQKWGCCCSMAPRLTGMQAGCIPAIGTHTARGGQQQSHTVSWNYLITLSFSSWAAWKPASRRCIRYIK